MYGCWILLAAMLPVDGETKIDFEHDIVPILTKAGCNSGACHGAAIGRGGFNLSLYGGDPDADYRSIVLQRKGRRVNLSEPDASLLLLKPFEAMEHGGGYRIDPASDAAKRLLAWIQQGAKRHAGSEATARELTQLQVSPTSVVVESDSQELQLRAVAHFSDGSSRDVTPWTVFTAEDDSAVRIDDRSAVATVHRRGRHLVIARYLSKVEPIEIIRPLANEPQVADVDSSIHFIDRDINEVLAKLRIPASGLAADHTFLRRVTLDLTGRLPTLEEIEAFRNANGDDRREKLVDTLIGSQAFVDYWTFQLAKLLRIHTQPQDSAGAEAYHRWLRQQLEQDVGYDSLAKTVLTALGDSHEIGPANFYRTVGGPREQAEFASELFMANRLRCANCHNHPLDQWTQDDYHGLAAIFATVRSGKVVSLNPSGEVIHPRTGDAAQPRLPGQRFLSDADEPLDSFAEWLTSGDNPFFAKAIVNRLWKALMGRGLVEPADDLRATNPATHPVLLDQLAEDFATHGFQLRRTIRQIVLSEAYARRSSPLVENRSDDRFYSHALRRPLEPEVLADAISDVLEVSERYGPLPMGTRAVTLVDPKTESTSLDVLGRCSRDESCETSGTMSDSGGLPRKLHLFNGALLNRRIASDSGRLDRLIREDAAPEKVVTEFYLAAFARTPSAEELAFWKQQLEGSTQSEQRQKMEDFVWSLLTCNEFVTNH